MDFLEIARQRQSCRSYDETKPVEPEKLNAILTAAQLGLIGSAFSVVYSCGRLVSGIVGDRLAP